MNAKVGDRVEVRHKDKVRMTGTLVRLAYDESDYGHDVYTTVQGPDFPVAFIGDDRGGTFRARRGKAIGWGRVVIVKVPLPASGKGGE